MLVVNQNSSNTIALTLKESTTLTGSTGYTMTLINDMSNISVSGITLTDTSSYVDRYNLFTLTVTGDSAAQNLTGGTVYLSDTGYYHYNCYCSDGTSTQLVETGKLLLDGADIITQTTYVTNDNQSYYVYQNK